MTEAKKILITSETREFFILHGADDEPMMVYCPECVGSGKFLGIEAAVEISSINVRAIISGIDSGRVHAFETTDRQLLICEASLLVYVNSEKF